MGGNSNSSYLTEGPWPLKSKSQRSNGRVLVLGRDSKHRPYRHRIGRLDSRNLGYLLDRRWWRVGFSMLLPSTKLAPRSLLSVFWCRVRNQTAERLRHCLHCHGDLLSGFAAIDRCPFEPVIRHRETRPSRERIGKALHLIGRDIRGLTHHRRCTSHAATGVRHGHRLFRPLEVVPVSVSLLPITDLFTAEQAASAGFHHPYPCQLEIDGTDLPQTRAAFIPGIPLRYFAPRSRAAS